MLMRLLTGPVLLSFIAGLLLVAPAPAQAGIARCEVRAFEPRRATPTDPEAGIEGTLTCDPDALPSRFTHTVCLQVKKGERFVDAGCCRVIEVRVSTTPWNMCAESWPLLAGTHKYRTRARAVRLSTGSAETDYSPSRTFTK